MADHTLLEHVADVVSAHVSNNAVTPGDLPGLIGVVHATLAALGQAPEPVEEKRTPAVSVRSSVKPDTITCLECGAKMRLLKRHLGDHGLTPAGYRARWNLPSEYPIVAPNYSARRKELAIQFVLGRKPVAASASKQAAAPAKLAKTTATAKSASSAPAVKSAAKEEPVKAVRSRKKLGLAFGSNAAVGA